MCLYDLRAFVMCTLRLWKTLCVRDAWFSFGVTFGCGPPTLSSTADTLAICCLCDDAIFLVTHPGASWFKNNVWLHQGSSHKQGTQLSLHWPLWLVDNAGVKRPESCKIMSGKFFNIKGWIFSQWTTTLNSYKISLNSYFLKSICHIWIYICYL